MPFSCELGGKALVGSGLSRFQNCTSAFLMCKSAARKRQHVGVANATGPSDGASVPLQHTHSAEAARYPSYPSKPWPYQSSWCAGRSAGCMLWQHTVMKQTHHCAWQPSCSGGRRTRHPDSCCAAPRLPAPAGGDVSCRNAAASCAWPEDTHGVR
jgi:hypothetical protein